MDELVWFMKEQTIPSAMSLLPGKMNTPEAVAMLLAIGFQESNFQHRRQIGNGPARGFWQFEKMGGVHEILTHEVTGSIIEPIARMFLYTPTAASCHEAIQHHDVLAVCFARLLLYVDPSPLPPITNPMLGWKIYLRNWRPGKPHPSTWSENFATGWSYVVKERV